MEIKNLNAIRTMKPPRIVSISKKTLVGVRTRTTLASDDPVSYWKPFRMRLAEIQHADVARFYSVQVMDTDGGPFTPHTEFEKWAAVEVTATGTIPEGMDSLMIPAGEYAVFTHIGTPAAFHITMKYIFSEWLPSSEFEVDARPHFEVMESNYRPDDPHAVEEVWIPIENKST